MFHAAGFWTVEQGMWEDGDMANPKFDSAGTHFYHTSSYLSPTLIYVVDGNPNHLLDSDHDTSD